MIDDSQKHSHQHSHQHSYQHRCVARIVTLSIRAKAETLDWAWWRIQNTIMWLSLNVKLNSKSFKTDLAKNFLYNSSEDEKINVSKQDDMYTDFWTWLSSETKLFLNTTRLLHLCWQHHCCWCLWYAKWKASYLSIL